MNIKHVVIGCILIPFFSINAAAQDYSGVWTGMITESINNCKDLGKAKPGEYKLTFVQTGDKLTAMENKAKRPYEGVFEGGDHRRVVVRGTYEDKGGYVTEEVTLDFTGDTAGKGHSVWNWSDGWFQCGGSFSFSFTKDLPK
jgi:hypothetical protein